MHGSFRDLLEILPRLVAAMFLSGIVGWERETREKRAGLRTHMLVGMGACSFTLITLRFFEMSLAASAQRPGDPIHLIEGIIGGIGFLGAGSIMRAGGTVEGLTTAAGIWVVGSVGIACGAGYYWLAVSTTGSALFILAVVQFLERGRTKPRDFAKTTGAHTLENEMSSGIQSKRIYRR